jgi:hypothetical protein
MKRTILPIAVVVSLLLVGLALYGGRSGLLPKAQAQANHQSSCSNASLKGTFGFYRTGTIRAGTPQTGALAAVGIITFDGTGTATGHQDISRNGVFELNLAGSISYQVNPECTFQFIDPSDGTVFADGVIVRGGTEIYGLSLVPGNAVLEVGKKLGDD